VRNPFFPLLKKTADIVGGHGLGRIRPIRAFYDFFFDLLRPRSARVQGHLMWLDDKDTLELAVHEVYEPVGTSLFNREIHPGQTVLDLGANIGYYTLIAARRTSPKGKVYAFEPDPDNFSLLQKNVERNGYSNVVLVNQAVSDHTGRTRLYLNETNKGDHRIYNPGDGKKFADIQVAALDDFFKRLDKKIHFIKMDVQGAEAAALAGMKSLVRANRRLKLFTEFEPGNLRGFGGDPRKYLQTLQKMGFKLFEASEKEGTIRPTSAADLLSRYTVENGGYTNLYCVKNN
jgi:FkbM family methyltransferase